MPHPGPSPAPSPATAPVAEPAPWRPTLALRLSAGLHGTACGVLALHPAWWPGLLASLAADHALLAAAGMWPRSQLLGPALHRLPQPGRTVALTFDDGPDPEVTPRVLDLLAASGAAASFFCIASRARAHPALLRRIVAEGHRVENHTLTHPRHFALLMGRALRREVADAQALLADVSGVPPSWFRAPMGLRSPPLHPVLSRTGLGLASWSRRGFDTACRDPGTVLRRLLPGAVPGAVLLLHDGNAARTASGGAVSLAVLPALLHRLRVLELSAVALPGATAATATAGGSPASTANASR